MTTTHEIKCDMVPFEYVQNGQKKAEVRKDDRGYAVGDLLIMNQQFRGHPTGRQITAKITHIQRGYGLPDDIVVLSFVT